jgi:hypothetical protein
MDSTLTEAAKALARIQRIETTYLNRRAKLDKTRASDITAILASVSQKALEHMRTEDPELVTEFGPGER